MYDALHSLQATGAAGFEGLIQVLISRVANHSFFLAKAGSQAGKDASTAGYGGTYIDIECKRYQRGASPATRDLLGGLREAIDASGGSLDLWLVVSTGSIGSSEAEALRRAAEAEAVAVEIIDWQETGLPQLAVLCAALPEETLKELQARGVTADIEAVASVLDAARSAPGFSERLDDLRLRLSSADLGLDRSWALAHLFGKRVTKPIPPKLPSWHEIVTERSCSEDHAHA